MNRLFLLLFGMVTFVAHAQVPDYVPTEGLVAWYPLDGDAVDHSSSAIHGTLNGPTLDEDRFGLQGALYFDGTDDYILIPHDEQLSFGNNSMTVSMWVRIDALPNGSNEFQTIMKVSGWGSSTIGYQAVIVGNGVTTLRAKNGPTNWMEATTSVSWDFGSYTHITYSLTDTLCSAFINGELVSSTEPSNTVIGTNDEPLILGWNNLLVNSGSSIAYTGNMDDVGFWNRALTDEEVLALYNAQIPIPGCTNPTACNFDADATSDNGSCIPSGCMETDACNYNALAECDGEACDYTCCPGPGCCSAGMYWDYDLEQCMNYETCQDDLDGDGVIGVNDLMQLLSSFGTDCAPTEEPETAEFTCGDPVSYHGYDYATVQIGEQCWFAENLRTELYQNEDSISGNLTDSEWSSTTSGAVSVYGEDAGCDDYSPDGDACDPSWSLNEYGRLYNWYAEDDARGLCPSGWHVPTDDEFMTLEMELGMSESEVIGTGWRGTDQGTQMKTIYGWNEGGNGTNSSGFSCLPGGYRYINGEFSDEGIFGSFWSSSLGNSLAWTRDLNHGFSGIYRNENNLVYGFSVRCLKD